MSLQNGRSSTWTLPLRSSSERAVGARGGTYSPHGRSIHRKYETPLGGLFLGEIRKVFPHQQGTSPPKTFHFQAVEPMVGFPPDENAYPWNMRSSPPGLFDGWKLNRGHGPPGWLFFTVSARRQSHDPPRQARGDPDWFAQVPKTCGHRAVPITSVYCSSPSHKDPPFFGAATGPPGSKSANPVNHWPPPRRHPKGGAPPGRRQARGDPPGTIGSRRGSDPPRSRAGPSPPGTFMANRRGPPGPFATHSSLSAERRRGSLLVTRPETARQDAARKHKPKSRKITPWL